MTVQDMDICLNISAEPAGKTSKKKSEKDDDSILNSMKVRSRSFKKDKSKAVVQSQNVSTSLNTTFKKRIKQKSLANIVAAKLNANRQSQNVQKDHTKFTHKVDKVTSKINEQNVQSNETSKPVLSFTKVTTENFGKTLLAKKRNISGDSKKSLSNIFSKQVKSKSSEFKVLSSDSAADIDESTIPSKKSKLDESEKSFHAAKKVISRDKKNKRFTEKKEHSADVNTDNKNSHSHHKSTGKIASLFGCNPEIPNIGQRFVKPIDEPVFAGTNFSDFNVHPFMISNLEQNMQITKMTTVQQKAIPQIFSGKDILVRSQTGSGKTLAYALPIVELLHQIRPKLSRISGLKALIVVPTRELALQTYECFLKLVKPFTWIVPGYLTGGEKRKAEKARLRKGCNILVGTPGRLLDHIKSTAALKLHEVKYFVLDEADRMFDMGYEKDISGIVTALKVATPPENTDYDAMKMLRQNVKKVFTDNDVSLLEQSDAQKKDDAQTDVSSPSKEIQNSESDDEEDKQKNRQVYHSSSDDDSEPDEPFVKSKKIDKRASFSNAPAKPGSTSVKRSVQENTKDSSMNESRRQTILLSATLTQNVEKLAGLTMENPIFVDAAKENLETVGGDTNDLNEDLIVPQSVIQSYVVTPPKLRMVTLSAYIAGKCQSFGHHKILIFMATQDMVDYHTEILSSVLNKPVDEDDEDSDPLVDVAFFKLHGNMTQKERTDVFKTFRKTKSGVLLCTDVAARGLDMPKVDCVVQYTGPTSARDYVHRIGRTARAGSSGSATIFLTPPEIDFVRMLESKRIRIKQEDMNDVLDKLLGPLSKHSSAQGAAIALQNDFENLVLANSKLREKAHKAYISWIRFYSSYPRDMREVFNRRELHLGHFAKSFALRDTPQRIGGIGKKLREEDRSKRQHNNRLSNERPDGVPQKKPRNQDGQPKTGLLKKVRMLNTSEYGSGLEPVKKPKKS